MPELSSPAPRTWLITGASRGLGRAFASAALDRGERVAALARDASALEALRGAAGERLLVLPTDVCDRAAVFAAFAAAQKAFGHLDIVVNNAGNLYLGMVEEFDEADARAQMETNFFGALWVSQAAAACLRPQGHGHLVQMSSIGALGGFPSSGLYSASKFALEGMSEALALELAPFGVKLTLVEPGGYWTELYTRMQTRPELAAYAPLRAELAEQMRESIDSDPVLAAEALLKLVNSDSPPLRLLLGSMVYDLAQTSTQARQATWAAWEDVSRAAEHGIPQGQSGFQTTSQR